MALGTPGVGTAGVAALYPPGSALLRLIQMYDAMAGKGVRSRGRQRCTVWMYN